MQQKQSIYPDAANDDDRYIGKRRPVFAVFDFCRIWRDLDEGNYRDPHYFAFRLLSWFPVFMSGIVKETQPLDVCVCRCTIRVYPSILNPELPQPNIIFCY